MGRHSPRRHREELTREEWWEKNMPVIAIWIGLGLSFFLGAMAYMLISGV